MFSTVLNHNTSDNARSIFQLTSVLHLQYRNYNRVEAAIYELALGRRKNVLLPEKMQQNP